MANSLDKNTVPPMTRTTALHDEHPDPGMSAGTILGKYRIVRRLGAGGMGAVYEAVHVVLGKGVALKTVGVHLASNPQAQARFLREAEAASRLDHPHVVGVTDFGTDGGVTYLVMELMRGEDLSAFLSRHAQMPHPVDVIVDIMLPVCAAISAAHEVGVVHRDLKPSNIFLARLSTGGTVPKVLDFGISKLLDARPVNDPLTNTGAVIGTTAYMSPEQVVGGPTLATSDQYTLGVILYECLTGQRPHQGETFYLIMRSITEGLFRSPRLLRPDLPVAMEAAIAKAMQSHPHNRFGSVYALGRALLPFASPKGQVMWSDYFARPPANKPYTDAEPVAATSPMPAPMPAAALSPTVTRQLAQTPGQASATPPGVAEGDPLNTADVRALNPVRAGGKKLWIVVAVGLLLATAVAIGVIRGQSRPRAVAPPVVVVKPPAAPVAGFPVKLDRPVVPPSYQEAVKPAASSRSRKARARPSGGNIPILE